MKYLKKYKLLENVDLEEQFLDACKNGILETAKKLLRKGVDPSVISNDAIRVAASNGHLEVVRLLLNDSRVDPSADDNCAIQWAAQNGHEKVVYLLLNHFKVYESLTKQERDKYAKGRMLYIDILKKLNR